VAEALVVEVAEAVMTMLLKEKAEVIRKRNLKVPALVDLLMDLLAALHRLEILVVQLVEDLLAVVVQRVEDLLVVEALQVEIAEAVMETVAKEIKVEKQ
jgi:predicted nucleic acid-binding protein